jgi:hypothetical protein
MSTLTQEKCSDNRKEIFSYILRWVLLAIVAIAASFGYTWTVDKEITTIKIETTGMQRDIKYLVREQEKQSTTAETRHKELLEAMAK